jgi:hypothetical protein
LIAKNEITPINHTATIPTIQSKTLITVGNPQEFEGVSTFSGVLVGVALKLSDP